MFQILFAKHFASFHRSCHALTSAVSKQAGRTVVSIITWSIPEPSLMASMISCNLRNNRRSSSPPVHAALVASGSR